MAAVGVVAGCVKWGSHEMLAHVASCTWFASPALAVGLSALMMLSMEEIKVKELSLCQP